MIRFVLRFGTGFRRFSQFESEGGEWILLSSLSILQQVRGVYPFHEATYSMYIHSSCSLSNRTSLVSSKASSPQRAIKSSRVQCSVSSLFLKVTYYALTPSSLSSRHFFPLSFIHEPASVSKHDVSIPVSLSSFLLYEGNSFLLDTT